MTTAAELIADHRCRDVHEVRWDVPTVLADVMDPCHACVSWGQHVASALDKSDDGLREAVRGVLSEALKRRERWVNKDGEAAVARAVAYQSMAGLLIRALEDGGE